MLKIMRYPSTDLSRNDLFLSVADFSISLSPPLSYSPSRSLPLSLALMSGVVTPNFLQAFKTK